jgi:hypothetical protein
MANLATLQTTATKTADWTSSWVDFGSNQDRWKFLLTVASFTGASTTDTVSIQGARDKDHLLAYPAQTLGTFPTANNNVAAEVLTIDLAKYADCRYIRAKGTVLAVPATGVLTSDTTKPDDGDTITIGTETYTLLDTLSTGPTVPFEVLIGGTAAAALANLKKAINLTGTEGTDYSVGTTQSAFVVAGAVDATTLAVTAVAGSNSGTLYATTKSSDSLSWGDTTLSGGTSHSSSVKVEHQSINASYNALQDGTQE